MKTREIERISELVLSIVVDVFLVFYWGIQCKAFIMQLCSVYAVNHCGG
jgi:hypothetical protein